AMSVKGMQKREPVLVADSALESAAIIACVSTDWVKLGGDTPKSAPLENGTMLVLGDRVPMLLVETTRIATGTHVVMRQLKTFHAGSDRSRVDEVRACL
ncbi:hypothetical protein LPN01_18945, partial [Sphingomonas sp. A2-49]|uniref:hypothetical protein n=1 Tax=Sphingomonas sp. A2-49 TaxID=1391375 RepID=UPI0021D3173C